MNTIEVTSPYDDSVVGNVPFSTMEEVEAALDLAYEKFQDRKNWLPKHKRIEVLENLVKI
ncbi:aldehyde dehydrogenase, partial [Halarcobacter ebronensis]